MTLDPEIKMGSFLKVSGASTFIDNRRAIQELFFKKKWVERFVEAVFTCCMPSTGYVPSTGISSWFDRNIVLMRCIPYPAIILERTITSANALLCCFNGE